MDYVSNFDKKQMGFNLYNKAKPLEYNVTLYISSVHINRYNGHTYTTKKFFPYLNYDNNYYSFNRKRDLTTYEYNRHYSISSNHMYNFIINKNIYSQEDQLPPEYLTLTPATPHSYLYGMSDIISFPKEHQMTGLILQYDSITQNNEREYQIFTEYYDTGIFNELDEFMITFFYFSQEQKYGIINDVGLGGNYGNYYRNYMFPHFTSILENFIIIKDNKLKDNPFNDTSVTLDITIFNDITDSLNIDLDVEDLYFILKYIDSTVNLEVYDIKVIRTIYNNNYDITAELPLLFNKTYILSDDINNLVDISKTKINIPSKISNVRFIPLHLPDFIIKDFDTLKSDGMQYHF